MDHVVRTTKGHDREEPPMETGTSIARSILMFPLTRLLIATGTFIGLQVLVGLGGSRLPSAWQGPLLTQTLSLLVALGVFVFMTRTVERRPLAEGGLTRDGVLRGTVAGFGLGAAVIGIVTGILALPGWYGVTSIVLAWPLLLHGLILFLLVAVAEEVLFRGVLFRTLEEGLGTWATLAIIALLFGLVHLANVNATLVGALGTGLAGVLLGAAYVLTRDLWLAIGIHWSLNFAQGTIFGMPVSGRDAGGSLLEATVRGPDLWTGGAYGIEAGLVTFLVTAVASAGVLWLAVRRDRVIAPRGMRRDRDTSWLATDDGSR